MTGLANITPPGFSGRDDLDRLMEVMSASFDPVYNEAWTRRQVEDAMVAGNCHYTLIGPLGELPSETGPAAGMSLSRYTLDEVELLLFAVMPEFRGKGLGRALLQRLIVDSAGRGARRIFLEMRRGNTAERLYSSLGFLPIGMRRDYYRLQTGKKADAITFAHDVTLP